MMDIIHLLPDSVANQIAAGEVVQRPASIVKEMVENSIDAKASNIKVVVEDGGKTCVQIIDDGIGMSETDARLSFERHATSKISKASDLFALTTMGFRGEALASIAAVAQVELKTRREEDDLGTFIRISGSAVECQEPVSCPVGCNFSVKNLFYNVPARRKFLKANQTELSNIIAEFERIVLVHPDVSFCLYNNGNEMYNLAASPLRQRIVDVFGKKINGDLLPVDVETSLVKISGYIGKPESAKKKGNSQFFFVNGRYMKHPYFNSAVMAAYDKLIPVGEHVSYFLYFSVDPSTIDVNVHPTKTEIKFDNEQPIWQVLHASIKESLGKFCDVPTIDFDVDGRPDIPTFGTSAEIVRPIMEPHIASYNPFKNSGSGYQKKDFDWQVLYDKEAGASVKSTRASHNVLDDDVVADNVESDDKPVEISSGALWESCSTDEMSDSDFSVPHFQYKGRYIVVPVKSGLMLVDQHRAHVRVLFDRFMSNIIAKKSVSQGVLFPEIVQLSKIENVMFENIKDDLSYLGFDFSDLGGGTYSINGVPSDTEGLKPVDMIHEMIAEARETGGDLKETLRTSISLALAKSASIVYGQVLSDMEMEELLNSLFRSKVPMRTPDGKLVFYIIKHSDIDKNFNV